MALAHLEYLGTADRSLAFLADVGTCSHYQLVLRRASAGRAREFEVGEVVFESSVMDAPRGMGRDNAIELLVPLDALPEGRVAAELRSFRSSAPRASARSPSVLVPIGQYASTARRAPAYRDDLADLQAVSTMSIRGWPRAPRLDVALGPILAGRRSRIGDTAVDHIDRTAGHLDVVVSFGAGGRRPKGRGTATATVGSLTLDWGLLDAAAPVRLRIPPTSLVTLPSGRELLLELRISWGHDDRAQSVAATRAFILGRPVRSTAPAGTYAGRVA